MKNKILEIVIFILLVIILLISVKPVGDYEYQAKENGNSKECYKQNEKLYCVVEVEWYANYGRVK